MKECDFAGWVTKNDLLCTDGAVIKHDAFANNDHQTVPLVWQHNEDNPDNVLGHIELENRNDGVYGRGYFNSTEQAEHAKELVMHGDINSMSIAANRVQRKQNDIIHGNIYEVSLVMAGANPGAVIDSVVRHSDGTGDEDIIYTGNLLYPMSDIKDVIKHSDDSLKEEPKNMDNKNPEEQNTDSDPSQKTIGEIYNEMTKEEQEVVAALVAKAMGETDGSEDDEPVQQEDDSEEDIQHSQNGGNHMRTNVFDQEGKKVNGGLTKEDANTYLKHAMDDRASSMMDYIADESANDGIQHGIKDIEVLFPEAKALKNPPAFYRGGLTNSDKIIAAVAKTPFAKVKTIFGNLTDDEARANGYIKGNQKIEEVFDVLSRSTEPQTIYKKQKLDRDDILDITDFDVVTWVNSEMRFMMNDEIARAILVGDGREKTSPQKIKEDHIRPVMTDDDFYTVKEDVKAGTSIIDVIIHALALYEGSGTPTLYASPTTIANIKLLKNSQGNYLFGDIPSEAAIATRLGLKELVPTKFMTDNQILIVNLSDYTIGANKGGELTSFDDFDIDFNQYKYLLETRISGALTTPKSAIAMTLPDKYFDGFNSPVTNNQGETGNGLAPKTVVPSGNVDGKEKH